MRYRQVNAASYFCWLIAVRDVGMIDVQRFDEIVEAGYREAVRAVADWDGPREKV